jgi:DNA-binding transcriptional MerR regulator
VYSIGKLCKASGLSRSTLLYYDSLGLLSPTQRTASNYRCYSEEDMARLEQICIYREAGVPLGQMKELLDSG